MQYILIIPGYNRYQESKEIKKSREVFYHRVLASLLKANPDDFVGLSKFKKIAKAKGMLQTNNGLRRNDCLVLELPFTVVAFPSQFDYANNNLSLADVQRNIKQDGGIDIDFSDHSPAHRVLLKWKEVNLVQIWTRHYRGDIRPQVQLKHIRGDDFQYCDELSANLEIVRDDTIQTLELALEYEKCKTRMLRRQLISVKKKSAALKNAKDADVNAEARLSIGEELANNRLETFAYKVNREYQNALINHYSGFQANDRLLNEDNHLQVYELVEQMFPLHFCVLKSLIFSKRAHQPKRSKSKGYKAKQLALVNQFCALVRIRFPGHLLDWAVVGTMAMWGKGVQMKYHRNTYLKAFTCVVKIAFKHLNKIWSKTKTERDAIIRAQIYMHHSSDNCQEYHAFATQRRNQPGVMHTGMVFNLVQAKEYEKPPGTVMKDPDGNEWVVVSSRLRDYWRCDMKLLRETFDGEAFSISKQDITFPLVGWNIVRLPNDPITHIY